MDFQTIFGVLGNLTAFITFLLRARSLIKIQRGRIRRSPELFSSVSYQYHTAIIVCMLWVLYGDDFLRFINIVGFFIEYFYLTLFILFTRSFKAWIMHSGIVIVELTCVYNLGFLALNFADPVKFVGTVCVIGTVFISFVKMVYETRRPPFFETVASFVNGFIWTIYALASSDTFILAANLGGGIVGLVRHVQYVKEQRERKAAEEKAKTEPEAPDFSKLDSIV